MEIRRPTEMVPLPVPLPLPTLLVRMPLEPPCPPRPWTELEMRAVLPMVLWMTLLPLHWVHLMPMETVPLPVPLPLPTLLKARMPLEPPCPPRPWTELEMRAVLPMVLRMPLEVPCPPHPWTELEMPRPRPRDLSTTLLPLHWVHLMPMETVPL